ncbi:hypothetical protein [Hathewaya limosa]|uniref:Uncharacterized protein n=1 Tax=Hathewaya limosa TaxID=1536 RepID=A0ABU0JR62_HATLI|nr:hypothetical protein [Hathewaya limosa]MDQ0478392.1 hypothetical protein [Hathewaya limosa]
MKDLFTCLNNIYGCYKGKVINVNKKLKATLNKKLTLLSDIDSKNSIKVPILNNDPHLFISNDFFEMLNEYCGQKKDIINPLNMDFKIYNKTFKIFKSSISLLIQKLEEDISVTKKHKFFSNTTIFFFMEKRKL